MKEYFIVANSFAALFFSDTTVKFVMGSSPEEAMEIFVKNYSHPCGLYAANLYKNSNEYHKGNKPLVRWMSNEAIFKDRKTGSIYKKGLGKISIENPKQGKIVT
ncbi:hypothetical protein [Candidatus Magnetobacterium casense]|uniref:Uncharacterized protein n=1 Tax=Candidatus Magnetobacterium casense TaxID=1455061 RepID=A0ABS6S1R7_9BACT|nr:hypothetical protein [Candidatus Magnetobacterium casensis]MBV6342780.1 hypothetical protein [Candidatus Magnetobacterium casensis]